MWLIKQKLNGIDPPASLTPEMVPPSMRKPGETVVVMLYLNIFLLQTQDFYHLQHICINCIYSTRITNVYTNSIQIP